MCKFCEQEIIQGEDELDFYDKGYYWDNEIEIADESGYSTLYMGVLRNGKYYISASGDDRAWYYPKYCPECGRKLVEEQMELNEFVEELDITIKQDGHDIYCDAETAEMLKSLINDGEKPKRLHKICTIYATQPNDTKKVDELLKNTDLYITTGYDDNGKFRYEVFEYEGNTQ